MKCEKCQRDIAGDDGFQHLGQALCDDCYMDALSPAKACDPWAVYLATRTRESSGMQNVEGLTPFQAEIVEFIRG